MRRSPLRVEQRKFLLAQTLHQSDQRDLRGVGHSVKHRFAKERAADGDAVKSAGEFVFTPGFNRVRMSELVQALIALDDLAIDPGVFAYGTRTNDFTEAIVNLDLENSFPSDAAQSVGHMKIFQRHDRARVGGKPDDRIVFHRHREDAKPIALEQKFRVDHSTRLEIVDRQFAIKSLFPKMSG